MRPWPLSAIHHVATETGNFTTHGRRERSNFCYFFGELFHFSFLRFRRPRQSSLQLLSQYTPRGPQVREGSSEQTRSSPIAFSHAQGASISLALTSFRQEPVSKGFRPLSSKCVLLNSNEAKPEQLQIKVPSDDKGFHQALD